MDVNREKAIDLAVSQIERQFGKGAIMKLGEGGVIKDIPVISTGSLGLDIALGIGGVPRVGSTRIMVRCGPRIRRGGRAAWVEWRRSRSCAASPPVRRAPTG